MTRFLKFINENNQNPNKGNTLTDIKYVRELLQTKYSHAFEKYKEGNIIYRGIANNSEFLYFPRETRKPRVSANTANYYTLLLDSGYVKWMNKFPKRSMSLICSTSMSKASNYGNIFLVFPENNAKIGICPEEDIWDSFISQNEFGFYGLHEFVMFINEIQEALNINLDSNNSNIFVNQLQNISIESCKDVFMNWCGKSETEKLIKQYKNVLQYAVGYLNLSGSLFKSTTIEKYNLKSEGPRHEIWTDASCLLIKRFSVKYVLEGI